MTRHNLSYSAKEALRRNGLLEARQDDGPGPITFRDPDPEHVATNIDFHSLPYDKAVRGEIAAWLKAHRIYSDEIDALASAYFVSADDEDLDFVRLRGRYSWVEAVRLDAVDLSVRSSNVFLNAGIEYIGDLRYVSEQQLLRCPNFGRKCLNEIREVLSDAGMRVGDRIGAVAAGPVSPKPPCAPRDVDIAASRAIRAAELRAEDKTYQEIGVEIGNVKSGMPITRSRARELAEKGERLLRHPRYAAHPLHAWACERIRAKRAKWGMSARMTESERATLRA